MRREATTFWGVGICRVDLRSIRPKHRDRVVIM